MAAAGARARPRASGGDAVAGPVGVLAAVAVGGALGAAARYGAALALPTASGGVPWSTFAVNATGCLLIGALLTVVERRGTHPLLRPFAGTGVLGGYTTFSTYAVDAHGLLLDGRGVAALAYLGGTAVVAVLAVALGVLLAGVVLRRIGAGAGDGAGGGEGASGGEGTSGGEGSSGGTGTGAGSGARP